MFHKSEILILVPTGVGDEVIFIILSVTVLYESLRASVRKCVCVCVDWSSPSWFIKWENLQLCSWRAHSGRLVWFYRSVARGLQGPHPVFIRSPEHRMEGRMDGGGKITGRTLPAPDLSDVMMWCHGYIIGLNLRNSVQFELTGNIM